MATSTYNSGPINLNGSTFYAWANPISAFMRTAGWVQNNDTGQVVWPAAIVNISNISLSGGVITATYLAAGAQGASLAVGQSITIRGATGAGNNATVIITGGTLVPGGTFTATLAGVNDGAETALTCWGSVNVRVAITNAIGNTTNNVFTYTNTDGILVPGQSVVVTGCTTAGFNSTWTVASIGVGTFTTTTGITHATEVETGTGIVACTPAVINTQESTNVTMPPAGGTTLATNYLYEVWKMGDAVAFPVYLRINYGTGGTTTGQVISVTLTLSAGTDGAGNATGGSTGAVNVLGPTNTQNSATLFTSYLSGSTNRIQMCLFPESNITIHGMFSVERSHDNNGNDTTAYATLTVLAGVVGNAVVSSQTSIATSNQTVAEIRVPALVNHTTATGTFISNAGASTLLVPGFPIVGAQGNPMIGFLIGKTSDWADLTIFPFTMYNTSHTYIIFTGTNFQGNVVSDTTPTTAVAMRYE
jgi:hypothetical protein